MSTIPHRIAALALAVDRFELLKKLINALRSQTRKPDEIIVVYQGTDASIDEWLSSQSDLVVVRQENKGSAGGFATGLETSVRRGNEWTWMFDDDAVPEPNALLEIEQCPYIDREDTTFLASRVVDPSGRTYMSPTPIDHNVWYGTVLDERCVPIQRACWLGVLVSSKAIRRLGLPIAEFFIREEDLEFTERMVRSGRAYCVLGSVVMHFQNSSIDLFGKDFLRFAYYARNNIARAMIEPRPWPRRYFQAGRRALRFLSMVATHDAPVMAVPWIFKGLFSFRPTVRYIE
jgi:GT2 family glycosyltransferase